MRQMTRPIPFPWSSSQGGLSRLLHDVVRTSSVPCPAIAENSPRLSAWETESSYELVLDLPGLTHSEVEVEFLDGVLTISGSWPSWRSEGDAPLREEHPSGEFRRSIQIDSDIDEDAVTATLRDGVLRATLPKKAPELPRRIAVGGQSLEDEEQ